MYVAGAPIEITVLAWSVVLLFVQIALQSGAATLELGIGYNVGTRDGAPQPKSLIAGRLSRALSNLLQTYPAFIALLLGLVVTGKTGGAGLSAAWLWLGARVAYLVIYALGIPVLRSLVWVVSIVGLVRMLSVLFA